MRIGLLNPEMPPVAQGSDGINRSVRLLSFLTSVVPSAISILCIGLVLGAAGGLLLGATAVVLLQSLELLADNSTLTDQSEKFKDNDHPYESSEQVRDIMISLIAVGHGVLSSILSVAVGLSIGYSTNSLSEREQTERRGEAARGKALAVAGSVCLTVVTATGCLLGLALESLLSITLHGAVRLLIILEAVCLMFQVMIWFLPPYVTAFICCIVVTPFVALNTFMIGSMLGIRLSLASVFVPVTAAVYLLQKSHPLKLHTMTVRLMLIISDVYRIAGQRIVALQSPPSTTASSVVVEDIFVGVLASLMWTVTVGTSLCMTLQRGGAGRICATAAATGSAVLGAIKLGLPVLGPGPIIGALTGVAGAAGVSLAAAGAATDQYRRVRHQYGLFGRLGVTVGAAVGAFLMSCAHSGLSAMFMALCAATVPAGAFLLMFVQSTSLGVKQRLCLHLVPGAVTSFTYTVLFYVMPSNFHGVHFVTFTICVSLIYFLDDFWTHHWVSSKRNIYVLQLHGQIN
ncbi:uncharacterized protein LOC119023292 isoform X2 [Acanthopagrus latus]|uniref:uncharacterized protein LOC119023292 isoform X2 n=1 Tax=Acanthopagrus latus TaxID=8177 RepID=UPI00187C02A9|nr:uncharacterized protein LOC119023292 isoform X2 [Acanthopagrus latus]